MINNLLQFINVYLRILTPGKNALNMCLITVILFINFMYLCVYMAAIKNILNVIIYNEKIYDRIISQIFVGRNRT